MMTSSIKTPSKMASVRATSIGVRPEVSILLIAALLVADTGFDDVLVELVE
jgi:hypothetical protein